MKILFVCEGFNRYSINAQPWKHVFEVAKRMQTKDDEVRVLTDADGHFPKNEVIDGVQVKRIKKGKLLFDVHELNKSLNGDFDIINWNASGALSALHFLRIKKLEKNLVWTLHSGIIELADIRNLKLTDVLSLGGFWNNILYSMKSDVFVKKAASLSNLKIIVTLSKRLKDYLLSLGVEEERIRVIYSGVDIEIFTPKDQSYIEKVRENMGYHQDESIILYYGPLSSFRGVDELVSAMPAVLSRFPDSRFIFLARTSKGDPKSNTLKKRIIAHKRATLVEGVQSRESLVQFLNIADVVVLPFRFWPYVECPLTVLETMALGKPLVTTFMGAIPEIVQDSVNGLLVNPRPKEIGLAITKLLRNKKLAFKLGKNARSYIEKFHSWDYVARQTARVFQECLA